MPVRPEAQQAYVESVLQRAVMHDEANVDDVGAQCIRRHRGPLRSRLYKLDAITFWVLHLEVQRSLAITAHRRRH